MTSRRWTESELELLRANYATMPREQLLALFPNRSWTAIENAGSQHQIRRAAERTYWTPEQIEVLKIEYPQGTRIDALAKKLKHSPFGINHMAARLKLGRIQQQVRQPNFPNVDRTTPLLEHLSEMEKGYLAGIFDGEGSVAVTSQYQLRILIGGTDVRLFYWLRDKIKYGSLHAYQPKPPRKRAYMWVLSTIQGAKFCRELAPYLIIKRDEALLVGEALSAGFAPLSTEQRQQLRNALHTLKTKGFAPT